MKNRFKIYDLRFMILGLVLVGSIINHQSLVVFADEATASSQSAQADKSLAKKLDLLKKEIASKAAALKSEVTKKMQNKALVGTVSSVEENQKGAASKMILKSKKGDRTILVNEYTIYTSEVSKKTKLTLKDFSKDEVIIALGDIDDKDNLNAKKIIKIAKLPENNLVGVWGQVLSRQGSNINIKKRDGQSLSITTSPETGIKTLREDSALSEIGEGKAIFTLGVLGKDDKFQARSIYILNLSVKLKSTASSSASKKLR